MKPGRELDTVDDLIEYLIAEGETVALQKLRQTIESSEAFDLDGLIMSLAGKANEDETGQGT